MAPTSSPQAAGGLRRRLTPLGRRARRGPRAARRVRPLPGRGRLGLRGGAQSRLRAAPARRARHGARAVRGVHRHLPPRGPRARAAHHAPGAAPVHRHGRAHALARGPGRDRRHGARLDREAPCNGAALRGAAGLGVRGLPLPRARRLRRRRPAAAPRGMAEGYRLRPRDPREWDQDQDQDRVEPVNSRWLRDRLRARRIPRRRTPPR